MDKTISSLETQNVIFFDGVCNLCNSFVQFIIKRDSKARFRFASLQSEYAQELLKSFPDFQSLDTVLLLENDRMYAKSDAALKIFKHLKGWSLISYLSIFPLFVRDVIYDLIARNRYRVFGKKESCMIPTPSIASRFIS